MRSNYYSNDPKWIIAKFPSTCQCGASIKRGDSVFYFPSEKLASCAGENCGKQQSRDFDAAKFDECAHGGNF